MSSYDNYSDEELGRMLKQAYRTMEYYEREEVSNFSAFCSWLELVGLGFISNALKLAVWTFERIKAIWRRIFS